jgi:hypothetical protein
VSAGGHWSSTLLGFVLAAITFIAIWYALSNSAALVSGVANDSSLRVKAGIFMSQGIPSVLKKRILTFTKSAHLVNCGQPITHHQMAVAVVRDCCDHCTRTDFNQQFVRRGRADRVIDDDVGLRVFGQNDMAIG